MDKNEFFVQVANSLSGCQMIEQELKLFITEALDFALECIGDRMTFEFSGRDYEDASLERLIHAFRKLCSNKSLVKDLEKFKNERNFLTHKAISYCTDYDGKLFQNATEEVKVRLLDIEKEAERIRDEISLETGKLLNAILGLR